MAKMCAAINMKWPDALPLILMSMRNTPDKKTGLSPHEILMGRAMRLPAVPANALVNITDDMVLDYCKGLADVIRSFSHQVEANTLPPIGDPGHTLQAGDWIHTSHAKKVTGPVEEELEVSGTTASGREVSELENNQEGTETAGEPTENSLVPQTVNEFERGDRVPISVEAAGELNQGEVLPEVDRYGLELKPGTDPEEEGEEEEEEGKIVERNPSVPESPEPAAGPSSENTISQEEGAVQRPEKTHRKKTHTGDNWPEKPLLRIRDTPNETITEENDTSRVEDLSEGEQQGERRLKRKRVANRRYTGPEWAYATTSEWQQKFLAFCFDREVPSQYYGT
ncbi:hypothetical protein NDU88_003252 [Pleurodeles waltl]|uniref:Uncharacterized protein n=1 Tax=Pleurodeles waltl TaxID=8319 RepID=A0AAV7LI57_PLEWA|nr:hypothetical protein NDU88_003252 [Pleurodeles waltl]